MVSHFLKKLGCCGSSFFLIFIWNGRALIPHRTEEARGTVHKTSSIIEKKEELSSAGLKRQLVQALFVMAEAHESIKQNNYQRFQTHISRMIQRLNQINVFQRISINIPPKKLLSPPADDNQRKFEVHYVQQRLPRSEYEAFKKSEQRADSYFSDVFFE